MTIRRILACVMMVAALFFIVRAERPTAYMKAEYEMRRHSRVIDNNNGEERKKDYFTKFILQVAPGYSYYYDPQRFFIDSLLNDPVGKDLYWQVTSNALDEDKRTGKNYQQIMKEMGFGYGNAYKCEKDFSTGKLIVRDSNMGDRYRYPVEMSDLNWELGDSVKNVLGYECFFATADYHGRKWNAWFAPEIPVQDGPWQLCGLPGLIMEASTTDGDYGFRITGIQECNEELKNPYEDDRYFMTNRKSVLKMKAYSRDNRAEQIGAMTGGAVKLTPHRWTYLVDFIETDYK